MKVLHVVFGFPPDPVGGTELYVQALCRELASRNIESVIAAPAPFDASYEIGGLTVRRFGVGADPATLEELYGGDPRAAARVEQILEEERPDVLHQHALTAACSAHVARIAKKRGVPVVFTYHTPTASCQRGSLLEWGRTPCDGHVSVARCTPCTLHGLGMDGASSQLIGRTPEVAGELLGKAGLSGGGWTALRMRSLMRRRTDQLMLLLANADAFVALSPWVRALLHANGVPENRIVDCAHGVFGAGRRDLAAAREAGGGLRVAHLGRMDSAKGTRVLIDAVRGLRDVALQLDVYGISQSEADAARVTEFRAVAADDARIRLRAPLEHAAVIPTLASYDLVAVPSQTFETGPLVVLEAFAAGVPVIGSSIGGVADKIAHNTNGWLVKPFDSVDAWRSGLSRCARDGYLLNRLKGGVRPPRTMDAVALEMAALYQRYVTPVQRPGVGRGGRPSPATTAVRRLGGRGPR